MNWTELNGTERLAKVWNLGNAKLQTRNCGLWFAVCGVPDAKGLYSSLDAPSSLSIGESLLTSLFTFFVISIRHRSRGTDIRRYELNSKVARANLLEQFLQIQLSTSNIEGNINHRRLRICWVEKKWTSHIFFVKFWVLKREFKRNHLVCRV